MNEAFQDYLTSHPKEAQLLLEELLRQQSVAAQDRGMQETADLVEKMLQNVGFDTRQIRIDGAPPYVYGEQRGKSPFTLLLYNHYDVQPEDPLDLWKSPPFEPTVRNGNLYARGSCDNKGEIASRLGAIHALKAVNEELPITIRWIIEGEEEIGSPHFSALAQQYTELLKADGGFWEGCSFDNTDRPVLCTGFKGMLYVEYEVEVMKRDAHSGGATALPSGAWRLVQALNTIRAQDGYVNIPGFYEAVRELTPAEQEAIANQTDMDEIDLQVYGISEFNNKLRGAALAEYKAAYPTANIAGIISGYTDEGIKTVLPAKAKAKMDFRLVPNQDPDDIFQKLVSHLGKQGFGDIKVSQLGKAYPVSIPIDHLLVQKVKKIAEEFSGKDPNIITMAGGTLPLLGWMERYVGTPGLSVPGNVSYWGSGAHAPNEHIRLSDLERGVRFNIHLFESLGNHMS